MLVVLAGQTASGKDSIARSLINDYGYKRVISNTTRPKRANEKEGVDYYFWDELPFNRDVISLKEYHTAQGTWWYWFNEEDIVSAIESNDVYITIADPGGVSELEPLGAKTIYIDAKWHVRAERYMNRESKNESPDYKEVLRRLIADQKDFEKLEYEAKNNGKYDIVYNTSSDLRDVVSYTNKLINSFAG